MSKENDLKSLNFIIQANQPRNLYKLAYVVSSKSMVTIDPVLGKRVKQIVAPSKNLAVIKLIASLDDGENLEQVKVEFICNDKDILE